MDLVVQQSFVPQEEFLGHPLKNAHFRVFWKIAPRDLKKREKIKSDGFPGGFEPQWFTKKISPIFRTRWHIVCTM